MKNKKLLIGTITIIVLIIIGVVVFFFLSNNKKEEVLEDNEVKIEKTIFRLDQEEERYGIHYKVDHRFRKARLPKYNIYYSSGIHKSPFFTIKIYRYNNKSLEEVIKDTIEKYDKKEKKKINDIKYTLTYSKYLKHNVKTYYYKKNNYIYVFSFSSDIDISRLEKIFMEQIRY